MIDFDNINPVQVEYNKIPSSKISSFSTYLPTILLVLPKVSRQFKEYTGLDAFY